MTILYFSPTGNAKYIAEKVQSSLSDAETSILAIEKTDPAKLEKTDHFIIVFSIHGFNPPRTVRRFVDAIPEGVSEKVSFIAVGCAESWINEAVTYPLRQTLEGKGYSVVVDKVIPMPLTFVMSFPEDMAKGLVESGSISASQVADEIVNNVITERNIPTKSFIINRIGRLESKAAKLFGLELHATKKCTSCGLCVRECPEKNIRFDKKNKPRFGLNCLMCLRCVYNCPEKAITPWTAKFIPVKGGYRLSDYLK